jgi:porphobilinogen synthase
LARETILLPADLIYPIFVREGRGEKTPILSMPGQFRLAIDEAVKAAERARAVGVPALALFPVVEEAARTNMRASRRIPTAFCSEPCAR